MDAVERWRSLPEEERYRRRLEAIPRHVANSMAMAGELVDEAWIRQRIASSMPAPRYVETAIGTISYQELAPLLAERVTNTELAIVKRTLTPTTIHDLILEVHRRICIDLTPKFARRWRLRDARVGSRRA